MTDLSAQAPPRAFEHTAHLYDGHDDFVGVVGDHVGQWVGRGDAVLVVSERSRLDAIRDLHGTAEGAVTYVDAREAGANPAALLPTWAAFVDRAAAEGRAVSGVGEPLWRGRSADEAAEVMLNERIVDTWRGLAGVSILCPYDVNLLDPWLLDEVVRHHPTLHRDGTRTPSERYDPVPETEVLDLPLPPAPSSRTEVAFDGSAYARVRELVAGLCARAGMSAHRTEDAVLVAHELATNCVQHGTGSGVMRLWSTGSALVVEARAAGRFHDPLVGRRRPASVGERGRGLWLVNRLCDLVQLRNTPDGTVVRAHLRLP